jgi:hypothetical protein
LLDKGHDVLILDNLSTGSIDNISHLKGRRGFEYFIDTVTNEPLLAELIDRSDVVFHFAAAVGVKLIVEQPVYTIETNVHGTEVVLKHANKKKETRGDRLDLEVREERGRRSARIRPGHGTDAEAPLGMRMQQGDRRVPRAAAGRSASFR